MKIHSRSFQAPAGRHRAPVISSMATLA